MDAKAPVAAFRSDRQAMRRSRRCVSQALRPDSQASPWSSFLFPSRASPRRRLCTPAVSRCCKQALHVCVNKSQSPLRALAAPPSTVAC